MARTFSLWLAMEVVQTFTDDQLEEDPEGVPGDFTPSADVLRALEERVREAISPHLHVVTIEIEPSVELDRDDPDHR